MRDLTRFLQARSDSHRTNVMTFDECVYTTYSYDIVDAARNGYPHHSSLQGSSSSAAGSHRDRKTGPKTGDLLGIPELNEEAEEAAAAAADIDATEADTTVTTKTYGHDGKNDSNGNGSGNGESSSATLVDGKGSLDEGNSEVDETTRLEQERLRREEIKRERRERFSVKGTTPEVFFMEYGTVVIWGMTLSEEKRLLREIRKFEIERLAPEDTESEELNWYLADYSR